MKLIFLALGMKLLFEMYIAPLSLYKESVIALFKFPARMSDRSLPIYAPALPIRY